MFVFMAGSSFFSQVREPIPEQPFHLKMLTKVPAPPPVKRKKLEVKPLERQVVPVKPVVMPEPKLNPEIIKTARVATTVDRVDAGPAAPRAFKPAVQSESGPVRAGKVELASRSVAGAGVASAAPRALQSSDSAASGVGRAVRVARVQGGGAFAGGGAGRGARAMQSAGSAGSGSGQAGRVARFKGKGISAGGGAGRGARAMQSAGSAGSGSGRAVRVARFKGKGAGSGVGRGTRAMQSAGSAGNGLGRAVRVTRFKGKGTSGTGSAPRARVSFGNSGVGERVAQRVFRQGIRVNTAIGAPRSAPNFSHDWGAARGYLARIRRKIDSSKQYPQMAKSSGQQGKVRVRFTILQNGRIEGLKLLSQTPYPALNKEALEMIKRAAPFSQLPDAIGMSALEVVLPFTFQLKSQFN